MEELKNEEPNTFEEDLNEFKLKINSGNKNSRSNFSNTFPQEKNSPSNKSPTGPPVNKKFSYSKTMIPTKKKWFFFYSCELYDMN